MKKLGRYIVWLFICFIQTFVWTFTAMGQVDDQNELAQKIAYIQIADKLISFNDQLLDLQDAVYECKAEDIENVDRRAAAVDTKWNFYNQAKQAEIIENDSLLQLVADYQVLKQELTDSLTVKKHYFKSDKMLTEIETLLFGQDSIYDHFYKEALEYSLVNKLAPLLEKLKVKEQLIFAELQANYEKSKLIGAEFMSLSNRVQKIEEKFIEIKNTSEKIQALKYKPLIQRIKDYLLGLAAISMILMFFTVIQSKIKVWKQNLANAKKLKEMMGQNDNEYPTI